jgi:signal transduction histidine kinase
MLQVTRSGLEMRAALSRLQGQFILGYSLFILGFSVFLFVLYHYSIYRPVRKLHAAIRRIKPGKRHERVPILGGRELAELGNALNEMLAAIELQQSRLTQKTREGKQLERRLRNSEQLAALGEMAASIGHEIGTPLATIDGYAQRGLRTSEAPATKEVLEAIRNEVVRIEAFIRELLSFGEGRQPKIGPIDFAAALSDAARSAQQKRPGGIDLNIDAPTFPGGAAFVRADPTRIRLVLKNILTNALQSKQRASVQCSAHAENGELVCHIDDDGPGIPPDERERIFAPFYTRHKPGGTGLGLALADRILHEYGGRLRATSSPSGGARFSIRLPLAS